ncbi:MAG: glucosyl transferase [Leptolyngbyaceae cyanobacterium SU_3_3]|nr:glucosyl transferase [Leptolyngbyaceae cyanobacterium SU_3_3]NJR50571.1 glucosyl transferase [Leptolyngbyaceae cyanobacterium CSU_1_3]
MIFVTVGTEQYPFNRLMNWVETLIVHGFIKEEVIVQYGSCTSLPSGVKVYQSLKSDRFAELVDEARLVISHCGEGSILLLEELSKPYILAPRSSRFREHIDDHQVELALALAQVGATVAWSPGDLTRFLESPQTAPLCDLSTTAAAILCQRLHARFEPLKCKDTQVCST